MLTSIFKTLKVIVMPDGFMSVTRQEAITDGATGDVYVLTPTVGCRCGDDALAIELGVDHIAAAEWTQTKRDKVLASVNLPEQALAARSGVAEIRTRNIKYANLITGEIKFKSIIEEMDTGSGEAVRQLGIKYTRSTVADNLDNQPSEMASFMSVVHTPQVIAAHQQRMAATRP